MKPTKKQITALAAEVATLTEQANKIRNRLVKAERALQFATRAASDDVVFVKGDANIIITAGMLSDGGFAYEITISAIYSNRFGYDSETITPVFSTRDSHKLAVGGKLFGTFHAAVRYVIGKLGVDSELITPTTKQVIDLIRKIEADNIAEAAEDSDV